ncbi:MAG: HEPN domain-containing protein, partial [Thermus sp.]
MPLDASEPLAWLARAKSNLARARLGRTSPEVAWEDPCFDAQQAAEKALKALLIALGIPFPKTHDLSRLLELIRPHLPVPPELETLVRLNPFAVAGRYPGDL